jgi:hypothetical protein
MLCFGLQILRYYFPGYKVSDKIRFRSIYCQHNVQYYELSYMNLIFPGYEVQDNITYWIMDYQVMIFQIMKSRIIIFRIAVPDNVQFILL